MSETFEFFISEKIKLKPSPVHGTGVFAVENINNDEVIEVSPLLKLDWKMKYQHDRIIRDYCWMNTSCQCQDCQMHGPSLFIAFGYGSVYNHHDTPNTKIELDYKNLKFTVKANQTIEAGNEVFVTYGSKYFSQRTNQSSLTTKEGINEQEGTKHT